MCIKIPVKEPPFDVIVRHISSLTSFSFIVELVFYFSEKGKRILFSILLFTGTRDRYVSNESGTTLYPFDVKIWSHKKGSYAKLTSFTRFDLFKVS